MKTDALNILKKEGIGTKGSGNTHMHITHLEVLSLDAHMLKCF
jgi:hypothetical protein